MDKRVAELRAMYTVEGGIVTTPGKFEGEPLWVPYFWKRESNERAYFAAEGRWYFIYFPDAEDVVLFPDLAGIFSVVCRETDYGYMDSMTFTDNLSHFAYIAAIEDEGESAEGGWGTED